MNEISKTVEAYIFIWLTFNYLKLLKNAIIDSLQILFLSIEIRILMLGEFFDGNIRRGQMNVLRFKIETF